MSGSVAACCLFNVHSTFENLIGTFNAISYYVLFKEHLSMPLMHCIHWHKFPSLILLCANLSCARRFNDSFFSILFWYTKRRRRCREKKETKANVSPHLCVAEIFRTFQMKWKKTGDKSTLVFVCTSMWAILMNAVLTWTINQMSITVSPNTVQAYGKQTFNCFEATG